MQNAPSTTQRIIRNLRQSRHAASPVVFIVDDDVGMRKLLRSLLERGVARVEVVEAENGVEALGKVAEIRAQRGRDPDLMILDLKMPVMSGWELIERLRKDYEARGRNEGFPILVFSQTSGETGLFRRHSVHDGKTGYVPLVTVAKERCVAAARYDAAGEAGLAEWLRHFLHAE